MKKIVLNTMMLLIVVANIFSACSKPEIISRPPTPTPPNIPQPETGFLSVKLRAVITIGDVVYDSIPATYTITSWDANSVALQKDTALDPGAQVVYLPRAAVRYSLKLHKWGHTYEKVLNKAEVIEGAVYQLGGSKDAKKLQWITEEIFQNGVPVLSSKQHFIYDEQGRIIEVHAYAPNPNGGALISGSMDIFLYGGNELWVNTVNKSDGALYSHSAYKFDAQGRTVQTKHQYLTEHHVYSNQYTSEGIVMLFGEGATNMNGSRIALKFLGGNRVEEKTILTNYPTTIKQYSYDFNINPYAVIQMPSMYFEHSSKNNVLAESWEGHDRFTNQYTYDSEGYVTEVITRGRNNSGQYENYSRTMYTF